MINKKPKLINLNLGTEIGTSVLELIKIFENVNKVKIPYEFKERRIGDSATVIADVSLATSMLKWSPKRDLKKMCIDGWKWQSLNPKGYN